MTSNGEALPLFFGPVERPLFGWYHAGVAGAREGLVICAPIGQEDINAHRTLRHLALAASRQGTPALRFDYDGCGDSAGDDLDADRLSSWLASIEAAIDELKRRAGVRRVCLLGVRLGALLASLVAVRRDDVSSLVAIAPVVSGRAFVREWRTLGLVREWKNASAGEASSPGGETADDAPSEAAGFVMSRATRDELSRIDPLQLPRVTAEVLIIDRDDLPLRDRWATHLAASGVQVTHEVLPGYLGMMSEPHNVQVPQAIVERVLAWLSRHGSVHGAPAPAGVAPAGGAARVSSSVRETLLQLDDEGLQFGILSEPLALPGASERRTLILLNSGACRHIGPNRMYVPLARQFAARGWSVLRVDVSGLGDSEAHAGQPDNAPYTAQAQRDIAAWVALLQQRSAGECHLLGICSGAYHGFKAAVGGPPLASVLAINPLVFFWRDGMPLDPPLSESGVVRMASLYQRSARDPSKWMRLLTGRVDVAQLARVLSRRVRTRARHALRGLGRAIGIPLRDDLVAELRILPARGARLRFIFSDGDPGLGILREQGGSTVDRLAHSGCLSTRMLPGTDHTFSTQAARQTLFGELEAQLSLEATAGADRDWPLERQTMLSADALRP